MQEKKRSHMIVQGMLIFCFLCLYTGIATAADQDGLAENEDVRAIGSTIIEDMDREKLSGILKTAIWLYDETWSAEPNREGGVELIKGGAFLGTVEKGARVRIVGFKRLQGVYRPSRDLVLKNHTVNFLRLKVLSGEKADEVGWFRKGTEKLVKFSVQE